VPIGSRSGINYQADFTEYKKILILKANTKSIRDVFAFFNHTIFTPNQSPPKGITGQVHEKREINAILRALEEDTDDDREGPDEDATGINSGRIVGETGGGISNGVVNKPSEEDEDEGIIYQGPVAGPSNLPIDVEAVTPINPADTAAAPKKPRSGRAQKSQTTATGDKGGRKTRSKR